jgi:hypothetical protein
MSEFPPVGLAAQARAAVSAVVPGRPADPRKYVLFAQGRTGSTLLGELLGSHPDVVFADEILRAKVQSTWLWTEGRRRRQPEKVFGFHVKIYQLTDVQGIADPASWLGTMHRRGWRVIALRRRNLVRHVLSNMAITATGTVHDRSGEGRRDPLRVDPAELVHWVRLREQVGRDEQAALRDVPHLSFIYEDDLTQPAVWEVTTRRAFAHLGVEPMPVSTSLHRRNEGSLAELIANYAEVASALHGTAYEHFLED